MRRFQVSASPVKQISWLRPPKGQTDRRLDNYRSSDSNRKDFRRPDHIRDYRSVHIELWIETSRRPVRMEVTLGVVAETPRRYVDYQKTRVSGSPNYPRGGFAFLRLAVQAGPHYFSTAGASPRKCPRARQSSAPGPEMGGREVVPSVPLVTAVVYGGPSSSGGQLGLSRKGDVHQPRVSCRLHCNHSQLHEVINSNRVTHELYIYLIDQRPRESSNMSGQGLATLDVSLHHDP